MICVYVVGGGVVSVLQAADDDAVCALPSRL